MKDLGVHLLLFAVVAFAIVLMSAFFSEKDDRAALRSFPRRFLVFTVGCGALAVILVGIEMLFASVG